MADMDTSCAGALGMLLYGPDPLESVGSNMTDYITQQDGDMLLTLLGDGPVTVTSNDDLPVSLRGCRGRRECAEVGFACPG